ncbi:regulator of nonsense transcripts 1 [Favolaschia claudopus]|uniref:Regulator of nonsense transcripts 1 n=1 Tax=Favolaschia claudopus TaxID=2862362 RepID=A0AAW0C3P7_9AGAR
MDLLVSALCLDLGDFCIRSAVDLLSASTNESRESLAALATVLGGEEGLHKSMVQSVFASDEDVNTPREHVVLQAWAAWRAASLESMTQRLSGVPRVDTHELSTSRLRVLSKLTRDGRLLTLMKPTRVDNEVDSENFSCKSGKLSVTSTRFQTRVLANRNQRIEVESTIGNQISKFQGRAVLVEGRAASITLSTGTSDESTSATNIKSTPGLSESSTITRVTTIGRQGYTRTESLRSEAIRHALQGRGTLLTQPFFQALWLAGLDGEEPVKWPKSKDAEKMKEVGLYFPQRKLNQSQREAVEVILSEEESRRVVLVQGPPGTGKTTVIAAAIHSILSDPNDMERTVWVVAQSNVAVKNIAEKLADADCDFTLLVSKDFHYDWHEHLYNKIADCLLRSDDLSEKFEFIEQRMLQSRVVLCTLSMLSNTRLSAVTRLVPMEMLLVDEASQVEMGDFVPMLVKFGHALRKMVFIGDDQQLPPYGASRISSLQSVFEMPHLRENAIFLDTQFHDFELIHYRMPEQLGLFIGKHVYGDKLKTVHHETAQCCWFVDVNGAEVAKGRSWINVAEAKAAIAEARRYYEKGESYRIITPYDAQRSLLENTLKAAKIPWENKVFCVDSFQGNEDDYIILSVVRSADNVGFLAELRRVNVMLTRCKRGMIVCANRAFIEGAAKDSLVGLLAAELGGDDAWD